MNKSVLTLFTVALVLIYASSTFAITVTEIQNNQVIDAQAQQLAKINAEMQAKFEALNKRLDTFPTQEQILQDAQALLTAQQQLLEQFKSAMLVMLIIIGFCFVGLGTGVIFYFKSKGRL